MSVIFIINFQATSLADFEDNLVIITEENTINVIFYFFNFL